MIHYLCNLYTYSKARLIRDIRLRHPSIEQDTEILTSILTRVQNERIVLLVREKGRHAMKRRKYLPVDDRFPKHHGGILDYKPPWEKLRGVYDSDHGAGSNQGDEENILFRHLVGQGRLEPRAPSQFS
jgi:hypothetical protein